jgi:hypothetical protein
VSQAARTSHNALVKLFLRLYAANLRRTWRNSPKEAWTDAIFTMDSLICVPLMSVIIVIWVIAIHMFPATIGGFGMPKAAGLAIGIPVIFVVDTVFTKRIDEYRSEPIARDSFSATVDRVAIFIAFIASFSFVVAMIGIIVMLHRRT